MSPFPQLDVDKGCSLQAMCASALTGKKAIMSFSSEVLNGVRQL
jgi:hypothetical protein